MTPAELDHRLMRFRDHYVVAGAIAPNSRLDMEFLAIIRDFEQEDWD